MRRTLETRGRSDRNRDAGAGAGAQHFVPDVLGHAKRVRSAEKAGVECGHHVRAVDTGDLQTVAAGFRGGLRNRQKGLRHAFAAHMDLLRVGQVSHFGAHRDAVMAGLQKGVAEVHRAGEFERTPEYRLRAALVVVMPRANAASAKLIVMFLRMFIVFLLFDWANLWSPSIYKGESGVRKL